MRKLFIFLFALLFSSSIFAQWTMQNSNFATSSRGIKFLHPVDTNVVWATGYDGVTPTNYICEYTRTSDGGNNWISGVMAGYTTGYGTSMICGYDALTAWVPVFNSTSGGGAILKTTDGGTTWAAQTTATFTAPNGFPNVVHFWNADTGFCMGDPNDGYFEIYTTTNGGTNWVRVNSTDIPANVSGEYGVTGYLSVVGSTVWFSTNKSNIFKSSDYGQTWSLITTPIVADKQFAVKFRSLNDGIIRMNESPYSTYETHDGGATWTMLGYNGNWYNNDFCYVPGTTDTWVSVGADATTPFMGISYSTDGGHNWTNFANMDTTQHLTVAFATNEIGWAGAFHNYGNDGMFRYDGTMFAIDTCAAYAASFSQSADTVDLVYSGQVNFTDLSSPVSDTWYWDFGDGNNSISQNPSHTYTSAGTMQVVLYTSHGVCPDTAYSEVEVINTSAINELQNLVSVFPNPAKDLLNIEGLSVNSSVEIYSFDGKLIFNTEMQNGIISTSGFSTGTYLLIISNNSFIIRERLVIE